MKQIILSSGEEVLVDDADFEKLSEFKWHKFKGVRSRTYYAVTLCNRKAILMHRLIMNAPNDLTVDHINLNGLDNRRENLRLATRTQQNANTRGQRRNKTHLKGVFKERNTYRARITVNNERIHLGFYKNPVDAARAYNEAALRYFGEFARLNKIEAGHD